MAQTFGFDIYVQSKLKDATDQGQLRLLAHELTHSRQYERRGRELTRFGFDYFSEFFDAGFDYASLIMQE